MKVSLRKCLPLYDQIALKSWKFTWKYGRMRRTYGLLDKLQVSIRICIFTRNVPPRNPRHRHQKSSNGDDYAQLGQHMLDWDRVWAELEIRGSTAGFTCFHFNLKQPSPSFTSNDSDHRFFRIKTQVGHTIDYLHPWKRKALGKRGLHIRCQMAMVPVVLRCSSTFQPYTQTTHRKHKPK